MEMEFVTCNKCGTQNESTNNFCKKCTLPMQNGYKPYIQVKPVNHINITNEYVPYYPQHEKKNQVNQKKNVKKGCLMAPLWILFLPVMGIITIIKSKKISKGIKTILVSAISLFCAFWILIFAFGIKYGDKWSYEGIQTEIKNGEYLNAKESIDTFIEIYPKSEYLDEVQTLKASVDKKAMVEKAAAEKAAAERAESEKAAAKAADEKAEKDKTTITPKTPTTNKPITTKKPETEIIYVLGTPLQVGDLVVNIISLKEKIKIESDNQFIDDVTTEGKFIVANIKFSNNDNKPRTIDSSLLTIIDSQSREYSVLNDMNLSIILGDKNIFLEEINPGMSLTGTFVFEVQKNINEYYLRISPGFISLRSDVTVKLK